MSWSSLFSPLRAAFPMFENIGRDKVIDYVITEEGKISAGIDYTAIKDQQTLHAVREIEVLGFCHIAEIYISSQTIAHGPKIYKIDQMNCEACEHLTLNMTFEEYAQPFNTMIVEFPEGYIKKRVAPCEQAGDGTYSNFVCPEQHSPDFVVVHWLRSKNILICAVYLSSGQVWTRPLWKTLDTLTIEEAFRRSHESGMYKDSLAVNDEEKKSAELAMRVGLNACSLLMELGCKKLGAQNQSHYDRLQRQIKVSQKNGKDVKNLFRELRICPVLYGFEQNVKLYTEEKESSAPRGHTGIVVRPHWRRGHRQRYWVNDLDTLGQKKSIIKTKLGILVNKHLYLGKEGDTSVTYEKASTHSEKT